MWLPCSEAPVDKSKAVWWKHGLIFGLLSCAMPLVCCGLEIGGTFNWGWYSWAGMTPPQYWPYVGLTAGGMVLGIIGCFRKGYLIALPIVGILFNAWGLYLYIEGLTQPPSWYHP